MNRNWFQGGMVEITSNIWGTKFKIHGLDASLPPLLGQVRLFYGFDDFDSFEDFDDFDSFNDGLDDDDDDALHIFSAFGPG